MERLTSLSGDRRPENGSYYDRKITRTLRFRTERMETFRHLRITMPTARPMLLSSDLRSGLGSSEDRPMAERLPWRSVWTEINLFRLITTVTVEPTSRSTDHRMDSGG